jgi:ketosteroid isomerase-like protein
MSQENVEIVRGSLDSWASGDGEAARAAYDSHAVMIRPVIDARILHGLPAIEAANEAWRRSWEDFRMEIEETIDAGDNVIVSIRQHGVGKDTGAEVELVSHGVFSLRNSKIIRAEFFESKSEALEAAGLRE